LSEALVVAGVNGETSFSPADLIRMLVVNRSCEPGSNLALLDWLDSVHYGGGAKPSYHRVLRAMYHLINCKEKAEPLIAKRLLPGDLPLDLVFYDIASTYFEGDRSLQEDDFRRYGYSWDKRFDKRQVVIEMAITPEGIPLWHHVCPGDTTDKATVTDVVKDLKERFALRRVVFVGDRGMLSYLNLEGLIEEQLGFMVAHPLRRNHHAKEVIGSLGLQFDRSSDKEQFLEQRLTPRRLPGRSRPFRRHGSKKPMHGSRSNFKSSSSPQPGGVSRLRKGRTSGSAITCATGTCSACTTLLWSMAAFTSRKTGRWCCGNRRSTRC